MRSLINHYRFWLQHRLTKKVKIHDGQFDLTFRCHSRIELERAKTLHSKEPGTVAWIQDSVKPGDVLYDIGANVGLYTLMAAHRVTDSGHVYAFEPHLLNAFHLLQNIRANGLQQRVSVLSCALHDEQAFCNFNYFSTAGGSSQSQCGEVRDDEGREFDPVLVELKSATTVDYLVRSRIIQPASVIKIDVDGNELHVLQGMREILTKEKSVREIQVEMSPRNRERLPGVMKSCGFGFANRHFTANGMRRIAAGEREEMVAHNALFTRQQEGLNVA